MPKVKIPPVLRAQTGGESIVEVEGEDVGAVLRGLADAHPGVGGQLFDESGDLNRYVNVYLNDEDVRLLGGLGTAVGGDDTVVILPAMAGGGPTA
ncbi:MAG: MoaD/ThiS family protein [Acidobacteria bacterium]|nr:MAG: MoaD/ThiS family protein [Acidobacteriota bacterium]GIK76999.1 MAG: sulfur carrier protein CysO [Actinomycetes bacterium]